MKYTTIAFRHNEAHICEAEYVRNKVIINKADNITFDQLDDKCSAAIRTTLRKKRYYRKFIISIPSGDMIIRDLYLPYTEKAKIDLVYKGELSTGIYEYDESELVADYIITESTEEGSNLSTAAIPSEQLQKYLDICESAGVKPQLIEVESIASLNFVLSCLNKDFKENFLLLHFSQDTLSLITVKECNLLSMRSITMDMNNLSNELNNTGATTLLSILATEVKRLLMLHTDIDINKAVIISPDRTEDISNYLSGKLELETVELDLNNIITKAPVDIKSYSICIGLALRGFNLTGLNLNFIREKFAQKEKMEAYKGGFSITLQILVVLVAVYLLNLYFVDYRNIQMSVNDQNNGIYARQRNLLRDFAREFRIASVDFDKLDNTEIYSKFNNIYTEQKNKYGAGYPIEADLLPVVVDIYTTIKNFNKRLSVKQSPEKQDIFKLEHVNLEIPPRKGGTIEITILFSVLDMNYVSIFDNELGKILGSTYLSGTENQTNEGWFKITRKYSISPKKQKS